MTAPVRSGTSAARSRPAAAALHDAVREQARRSPRRTAIVDGDVALGYAELVERADRLSGDLLARGVRRGDVVPVLLPRSADLVVALLATVTAGAAYAAIDPRWPAARRDLVAGMLESPVTITAEGAVGTGAVDTTIPAGTDGGDAATLFFTSGTTGRPKGVLTPHRAVLRLFDPGSFADFGPGRVVPVAAPVPWDAFAMELWGPLVCGGTAVLVDVDMMFPDDFAALVRDHGVDTAWLTASLFNLFVDEDPGCLAGMRQLIIGGERLSVPHVRRVLERHPGLALTNGYGPVESCVFATTHRIRQEDCDHPTGVPIGRPVPGTGIALLDGDGNPGDEGEIVISGVGLAAGYLGDPDQTARCFVTLPLEGGPTRVYRTGDLGRRDGDGVLHYLGRADRQVKVLGHRVEPAEVEAVTSSIEGVRAALVVPVPDIDGRYERLALFAAIDEHGPSAAALREVLRTTLPHYMVPATVRLVDGIPRTSNGKADHHALLVAHGLVPDGPSVTAPYTSG